MPHEIGKNGTSDTTKRRKGEWYWYTHVTINCVPRRNCLVTVEQYAELAHEHVTRVFVELMLAKLFCSMNSYFTMDTLDKLIDELADEINVKPKRIIKDGFENASKLEPVKSDLLTRGQRRKQSIKKRESTAGAKWFDLPTKDLEVEDKLNLDAIRLRESLNPKKFYKNKSTEKISKHFQVGTVVEHPIDYYSGRATRKERKQTLVDELIADAEFKKNVKQRYRKLKAANAIKQKEKALAERRKMLQAKKKKQNKG